MEASKIWLVVADGPNEGDVIPVSRASFRIGRRADCQFRPGGEGVADLHCAVVARDGRFYLQNFHQPDGTSVGGRQVLGILELHDRDRFQVGEWQLQVRIARKTCRAVDPPSPVVEPAPAPRPTRPLIAAPAPLDASKAGPARRTIMVGRKDRVLPLLRQREWEAAAQTKSQPPRVPPRASHPKRWWPVAGCLALVVALAGAFYFKAPSAVPTSPASIGVAQNYSQPRIAGPQPPRRRAAAPDR